MGRNASNVENHWSNALGYTSAVARQKGGRGEIVLGRGNRPFRPYLATALGYTTSKQLSTIDKTEVNI